MHAFRNSMLAALITGIFIVFQPNLIHHHEQITNGKSVMTVNRTSITPLALAFGTQEAAIYSIVPTTSPAASLYYKESLKLLPERPARQPLGLILEYKM